ncbi:MAG: acyl-CoA carboxylase subunit beta [Jatrophihabitans sp.]
MNFTGSEPERPSLRESVDTWRDRRKQIQRGDATATERQHAKRKLTARERIGLLLDEGSFAEIDLYRRRTPQGGAATEEPHTSGVITGSGTADGRTVFVYAQDFRIFGGALDRIHAEKIHKVMDLAIATGSPLIAINDSGGALIQEGVSALAGYGGVFERNVRASGVIPQISIIVGPCAGGAAYSPALTDFVFMVRNTSYMFLTGPDVVREVTGAEVTHEMLGGAEMHAAKSGTATFVYEDEATCFQEVRYLLTLLPSNSGEAPPSYTSVDRPERSCERLLDIVPADPVKPYEMRDVVTELVDSGEFMEFQDTWAENVVCALARIEGRTVGIVGNQPMMRAGVLDIDASDKAARFVRTCDAFNIPLVTLVDVPGFLPGLDQEQGGIIRHGAKLLYAYCEATVPRIQIILRKAYGGAYIVMDSRSIGSDASFAWPSNEIAVMGAQSAVSVVHGRRIAASADPPALRAKLIEEYRSEMMHPYYAAERGLVDDIIDPADTRLVVARTLRLLRGKRVEPVARKHGNQPV